MKSQLEHSLAKQYENTWSVCLCILYLDGKKSTYFQHVRKTDMQFESQVPLENLGKSEDE